MDKLELEALPPEIYEYAMLNEMTLAEVTQNIGEYPMGNFEGALKEHVDKWYRDVVLRFRYENGIIKR